MAVHKLHFDDDDEEDYQLIAIHTIIEDYRLAYLINQKLPILLSKNKIGIPNTLTSNHMLFERFTFEDLDKHVHWNLIENKQEINLVQKVTADNLFQLDQNYNATYYFLPEFKKVDYFLKVGSPDVIITKQIITLLSSIDRISTVYNVNKNKIKSKNNLIF